MSELSIADLPLGRGERASALRHGLKGSTPSDHLLATLCRELSVVDQRYDGNLQDYGPLYAFRHGLKVLPDRFDAAKRASVVASQAVCNTNGIGKLGDCPDLDMYHHETLLGGNGLRGETTPIVLDGRIIGIVKRCGQPSMLALRNVGTRTAPQLIIGAAYQINGDIAEQAHEMRGYFAPLHISHLTASPLRFIDPAAPAEMTFNEYVPRLAAKRHELERRLRR